MSWTINTRLLEEEFQKVFPGLTSFEQYSTHFLVMANLDPSEMNIARFVHVNITLVPKHPVQGGVRSLEMEISLMTGDYPVKRYVTDMDFEYVLKEKNIAHQVWIQVLLDANRYFWEMENQAAGLFFLREMQLIG